MEYDLLWADSICGLVARVNDAIHEGWKPHGTISISRYETTNERKGYTEITTEFYQPMVKE